MRHRRHWRGQHLRRTAGWRDGIGSPGRQCQCARRRFATAEGRSRAPATPGRGRRGKCPSAILDRNFVLGMCAVRRIRWAEVGGFDPRLAYAADWEFWQRLIFSGSRVGLVDEPNGGIRSRRGNGMLTRAIRRESRNLAHRMANDSLSRGGWPARREFSRILLGRGFGIRARLGAVLAVASPTLAARRRNRRADGMVEIGAGLRVPRSSD